jgi:di/tricarboxylate transporter
VASVGVFVLAGLFALNVIAALSAPDLITETLRTANPTLTEAQVEDAVGAAVVGGAVFGLVVVGLLVWFGVMLRRQRNWARVAVSVLLTIGLLLNLNTALASVGLVQVFSAVTVLVVGGLLFLLWRPAANRYFTGMGGR